MPALSYDSFDPAGCGFVTPRVSLLPVFWQPRDPPADEGSFAVIGAGRPARAYTRGRYALHDAYRLCGIGPSGALLAPAYHCRTMLDPAISLAAPLLLYPLSAQLVPDLVAIRHLVEAAATPVRALLVTHYFGFAQSLEPLAAFCAAQGIALIEDCSHALFDRRAAGRLGAAGRYVTASPYKMFPSEEGGLLIANGGADLPDVRRPGPRAEAKVLANALERAWAARRHRISAADVAGVDAELDALQESPMPLGAQRHGEQPGPSSLYVQAEEGLAGATSSRGLMGLCSVDRLAARRRRNYRRWCEAVRGVPNCRPLFAELPDDCVPYMFALEVGAPQAAFHLLKRMGVPIWRWDDMASSGCAVSQRYRLQLLHLPCHQSLSEAELVWMTQAVVSVLRRHGQSGG